MKRKSVVLLIIVVIAAVSLWAMQSSDSGNAVGIINYIDGDFGVWRNGELLDSGDVYEGFEIEESDLLETYEEASVEVELTSPSSNGAIVTIAPMTVFSFEYSESGGEKTTAVKMMAGKLSLKVQKLAGGGQFEVQTESVTCGVRGTEFDVVMSPETSVLVACKEGKVANSTSKGKEVYAQAGVVVEKPSGHDLKSTPVDPKDLDTYVDKWSEIKAEVFKSNALGFTKFYSKKYPEYLNRFEPAYKELMSHKKIFKKFEKQLKAGGDTNMSDLMKDRTTVNKAVMNMRSILPIYEQSFYRLKLISSFHKKSIGRGNLGNGTTSDQFYRVFDKQEKEYSRRLSEVRYIMKIYSKRISSMKTGGMDFSDDMGLYDDLFNNDPLKEGSGVPSSSMDF